MSLEQNIQAIQARFPLGQLAVGLARGIVSFQPNTFCILLGSAQSPSITMVAMSYAGGNIPPADLSGPKPLFFARSSVLQSIHKYGREITPASNPNQVFAVPEGDILRQAPSYMGIANAVFVQPNGNVVNVLPISVGPTTGMSVG